MAAVRKTTFTEKYPHFLQYAAALSVSIIYFMNGNQDGWSGPMLLKIEENGLNITRAQSSWLTSTALLGQAISPVFGAIGGNMIGRRLTILVSIIPALVGTLTLAFSRNVAVLCVGRLLCGIGIEIAQTLTPLYVGEICTSQIRGRLTYFLMFEYNFGLLFEYATGTYMPMLLNGLVLSVFPVVMFATFWWMPESPYYYVMKGRYKEASESLHRLHITDDADMDFENIKIAVENTERNKGSFMDLFLNSNNRKALLITIIITNANILTGINVLLAYSQTIFDAANTGISPNICSMMFAATGILVVGMGSFIIDSWGRRPVLILSMVATTVPLLVIGLYFYLQHIAYEHLTSIALVPVIAMILMKIGMSVGVSSLPHVCRSELFPANVSANAACVVETYSCLVRFAVTLSYQSVADKFGLFVVFWGFSFGCILSTILIYLFVPETKNKPLETIQENLRNDRFCVLLNK